MAPLSRRSASPRSVFNCGEDLWLQVKAIHRFRGILDRGMSIGSAVRGPLVRRRWIHPRTMSQAPSWKGKETG